MSAEEDIRQKIAQFGNSFDLNDWDLLESATRYRFGLANDQDRGWVIDRIKQTVLWNEGDPDLHSGVNNNGHRGGWASKSTLFDISDRYVIYIRK